MVDHTMPPSRNWILVPHILLISQGKSRADPFLTFMATGAFSAEFSADRLMQSVGGTHSGKLYFKSEDINRTEMMGIISIFKRPMPYQLFPDTQKYVVMNIDDLSKNNPAADAANFKEWIENNNLKKTGTETLEGYKCDIFEGDGLRRMPPAILPGRVSEAAGCQEVLCPDRSYGFFPVQAHSRGARRKVLCGHSVPPGEMKRPAGSFRQSCQI